MSVKEQIHRLVDHLPDAQLEEARRLLEELSGTAEDDVLDKESAASLERGLAEIRAGRVKSLKEYEAERRL